MTDTEPHGCDHRLGYNLVCGSIEWIYVSDKGKFEYEYKFDHCPDCGIKLEVVE